MTTRDESMVFHAGERAVQARAGVADLAARLGARMVQRTLDPDFAAFLAQQPFVVLGSATRDGAVWASVLSGPEGFVSAVAPDRVVVRAAIDPGDPLGGTLALGPAAVGLLAIDLRTRGRIRLNGVGRRTGSGLELELREVFGNCPKHIGRRAITGRAAAEDRPPVRHGGVLAPDQRALLQAADTCFVASRHPSRGADVSHRGGRPGFIAVTPDGAGLTFPDLAGNNLFQTLGNLACDPAVGLLVVDWTTGRTVQLTGRATVVWDEDRVAAWPGAQRLVDVRIEQVIDRAAGMGWTWELLEAHRLNPALPRSA